MGYRQGPDVARGQDATEAGGCLELLGDAAVDGVVAINADLVARVVGEVKGEVGVCGGAADAGEDLADKLRGVDAEGLEAQGLGSAPLGRARRGGFGREGKVGCARGGRVRAPI